VLATLESAPAAVGTLLGTVATIRGIVASPSGRLATLSGAVGTVRGTVASLSGTLATVAGAVRTIRETVRTAKKTVPIVKKTVASLGGAVPMWATLGRPLGVERLLTGEEGRPYLLDAAQGLRRLAQGLVLELEEGGELLLIQLVHPRLDVL
jgi:hypothetical protein